MSMATEEAKPIAAEFESEEAQQTRLFHYVALITLGGSIAALIFLIVSRWIIPQFPSRYLTPVIGAFVLGNLVGLWLLRRQRARWAIAGYLLSITATLFYTIYFMGGSTGPMAVVLVAVPIVAGLVSGRRPAILIGLIILALYAAMVVTERIGWLTPRPVPESTAQILRYVMLALTILLTFMIVAAFAAVSDQAKKTVRQQTQKLIEANRLAQEAAQAEREARARESQTIYRLQQTVREYTRFLDRVTAGDYSTRLDLAEADESPEARQLFALGHRLNATVESLVASLQDLQAIQRRYVRESWDRFLSLGYVHAGFRYRNGVAAPDDAAWLSPMEQAVKSKRPVVGEQELALPLLQRGEVIGALGIRRDGADEWSADDLALVQTITDQLAQTVEALRLLDETQRRAAHEALVAEVTASIRESLEMDTMLQVAIREMGKALDAAEVEVRLGSGEL
ncbi:MAG: GAF domain-containing protein [Anaerolineae bacterium]|nr:GAF domain-containing protein [Anaerolineae bacterium]